MYRILAAWCDLLGRKGDEIRELDFQHRLHARQCGTHCGAGNAEFGMGVSLTLSSPKRWTKSPVTPKAPP